MAWKISISALLLSFLFLTFLKCNMALGEGEGGEGLQKLPDGMCKAVNYGFKGRCSDFHLCNESCRQQDFLYGQCSGIIKRKCMCYKYCHSPPSPGGGGGDEPPSPGGGGDDPPSPGGDDYPPPPGDEDIN